MALTSEKSIFAFCDCAPPPNSEYFFPGKLILDISTLSSYIQENSEFQTLGVRASLVRTVLSYTGDLGEGKTVFKVSGFILVAS